MARYTKYNALSRKKKAPKKQTIVLILSGLILLFGILLVLDRTGVINLPFLSDKKPAATPSDINYDPPTEQEKNETEQFKENLGKEDTPSTTPTSPTTTKKSVTPIMTSGASNSSNHDVEVSGYVPGINEEGGTCILILTKGDQKVPESKAATPNATTVSCGFITIARDRLSAGTWSATLSYSSASSEGVSTSKTIEVN